MKRLCFFLAAVMIASAFAAALPSYAAETGFSDVEEGRWSAGSIEYAVKEGYMNGVGGGKFDPEGSLTRAMVATVLWRREESPEPTSPSGFEDVPSGEWYTDAVAWAKETEVVKGLTMTTFGPDEYITREQLATMLFRFSSSAPVSVPERADLDPFADDETVSDWAAEPLGWAVQAGLINGTDGKRLDPEGYATREQFAAIIERYDDTFILEYNDPVLFSEYTEKEYPLVDDADFYVATDGDDSNPGTFDAPLATFAGAAAKVREIKAEKAEGDIVVAFMAGDYGPLSVELTAEDSGTPEQRIVYCKYGDGDVTFDGGGVLSEEDFRDLTEEEKTFFNERYADRIKRADISDLLEKYDPDSMRVFTENGSLYLARFPNKSADGEDAFYKAGYTSDENHIRMVLSFFKKKFASYRTLEGVRLYGYLTTGWYKDTLDVGGYDPETGDVLITNPEDAVMGSLRYGEFDSEDYNQTCILNASEELDGEGEYWIDRSGGSIYVFEPKGEYKLALEGTALKMDGTDDVTLRGLTFKNESDVAIYAHRCHGLTVEECEFIACAGKSVIFMDNSTKDLDLTVRNCFMDLCSGGLVKLYGGYQAANGTMMDRVTGSKKHNVVIDNNLFTNFNLEDFECQGVDLALCVGATVTHNEFINGGRGAISFSGCDLLAEYNYFKNCMNNSNDGGVCYADGGLDMRNIVIRHNVFDTVKSGGMGQYCVYIDDGQTGFDVSSNLFFSPGSYAVMIHDGRDNSVSDNVIVCTAPGQGSVWISSQRDDWENALAADPGADPEAFFSDNWLYRAWVELFAKYEKYPDIKAYIGETHPEVFDVSVDPADVDGPSFAVNSTNSVTGNRVFSFICENGLFNLPFSCLNFITDVGNVFSDLSDNPLFVNPSIGDYRIRDGVDFPDIEFEKIGRY